MISVNSIMNILPYKTFTLQTAAPLAQVQQQLANHIEAPKLVRWAYARNHAPYQGTMSDHGFEIRRIIHHRNSFLPNVQGRFEAYPTGTTCHVTMQLHPLILAFSSVWLSVWYMVALPITLFGGIPPLTGLAFLGMPIGVFAIFLSVFHSEAAYTQRELTKIITGREGPQKKRKYNPAQVRYWLLGGAAVAIAIVAYQLSMAYPPGLTSEQTAADCAQANPSPHCQLAVTHQLEHPSVISLAMSDDGKTLVSGGRDKAIRVWDVATGQLTKTLQSDSGTVEAVAVSSDGNTIVSAGGDRMVRIWDLTSAQPPRMMAGHQNIPNRVAISADGKTLISTAYSEIKLWDMTTGELQATLLSAEPTEGSLGPLKFTITSHSSPRAISPAGDNVLVSDNGKWFLWDVATRESTRIPMSGGTFAQDVDISPDGQSVVTVSYRQPITFFKVWDLTTGELQTEGRLSSSSETHSLNNLVVSRDSTGNDPSTLIIGSTPNGLKIWTLPDKQLNATLAVEPMRTLVSNRDGTVLAGVVPSFEQRPDIIQVLQNSA